jgi:hypothetical protein
VKLKLPEKLAEKFKECKKASKDVIPSIENLLTKKKIKYEKIDDFSLKIISKKSKDDIKKIIYENIDLPKDIIKMLLSLYSIDKETYMIQRMK